MTPTTSHPKSTLCETTAGLKATASAHTAIDVLTGLYVLLICGHVSGVLLHKYIVLYGNQLAALAKVAAHRIAHEGVTLVVGVEVGDILRDGERRTSFVDFCGTLTWYLMILYY